MVCVWSGGSIRIINSYRIMNINMKTKKQKKTKKLSYHAKLMIYGLPEMLKPTKTKLIKWLDSLSRELKKEKDMKIFTKRFTLRLMK